MSKNLFIDKLSINFNDEIDYSLKVLSAFQLITSWEVRPQFSNQTNIPVILDCIDSLNVLLQDRTLSIARIADGELGLMTGVKIPNSKRQHFSDSLKIALRHVMKCENPKCRVSLPKWFIYRSSPIDQKNAESFVDKSFLPESKKGNYFNYFKPDYEYLDACMSVPDAHYGTFGTKFVHAYYSIAKQLFKDEDIILVTGDVRHSQYEFKLVNDNAKSTTVLPVPSIDAWSDYQVIKEKLLKMNPSGSRQVVLCCGAAATVLAYNLSDTMRCLDLGHMLGDYNIALGGERIGKFWQ